MTRRSAQFTAVTLSMIAGFAAHAQNQLRLVARATTGTPTDPTTPNFVGSFTNLALSPTGRVAFNAQHRVPLPSGTLQVLGGAFVEGPSGPALITAGLINDSQNTPAVYAIDGAGNVLLRGRLPNPPQFDALVVNFPSGLPQLLTSVNAPAPGIPNGTVGTILPVTPAPAVQPTRILPLNLRYPIPVTLVVGGPVAGAMLGGSTAGLQLLATSSPLGTSNPPPVLPIAWPYDIAQSGSFVIEGASPRVYHNGTVLALPTVNTLIPGGLPNERVIFSLNSRIASNGNVIAGYANNQGGAVILMGPPDDLQIVFRSGQIFSSSIGTVTASLELVNGPVPMSIDDNGVGYVLARSVQLSSPNGSSFPFAVIRVQRGTPPRIAYLSTEPVRARTGELVPPAFVPAAPPLQTVSGGGRFIWRMNIAGFREAFCSFTDAGDPYIVFAQGDSVGSPPVSLTSFLPVGPNTTYVGRFANNARGDAAIINSQQSANIVSPAPDFTCGDIDFNNDGVWPDERDVIDFFDVYSGAPCPTLRCDTLDFNRNGVTPEDQDVIDFFNVLAGGTCN